MCPERWMATIDTSQQIRVLVAATYPTIRAGLRFVVERDPIFDVAGDANGVDDLAAQIEHLAPHVILLDLGNDLDELLDVLEPLSSSRILPPVVLMASSIEPVAEAIDAGIQGYLLPDATPEEIGAALRSVVAGLTVIDSRAMPLLLERRGPVEVPPEPGAEYETLTPREREVLQLIAQGLPNKTIARELGISEHTVKFHVGSILSKLEASSRAEALARAARLGLIVL